MKPKTTVVLILLSTFSIYFLCPVLCPLIGNRSCGVSNAEQPKSQSIASIWQFSEPHSTSSACCRTKKSETTPCGHSEEDTDNCCLDHLGILKAREYQRFSQTVENFLPAIAVIVPCLTIPVFSTNSTVVLNPYPDPIPDPTSYQISPRAPPFSLA